MDANQALDLRDSGVIAPEQRTTGTSFERGKKDLLYGVVSTRYVRPFFCGRVHEMLLALLFKPTEDLELRFAFNAQGGEPGVPAWDYQTVVPNPKEGRKYSFAVRLIYKPFTGLDEVASFYDQWD